MESPGMGEGDRVAGFGERDLPSDSSMYHAFDVIQQAGDISPTLLLGGFKVSFITIMYGMLIYGASLVIRMLQKPKI